jgi:hypothetical protein
MTYWQIAAGSRGRNYANYFLRHGIAFVGDPNHQATIQTVGVNDTVVLKAGRSSIVAAGKVGQRNGSHVGCNDKDWLHDFDGWDLPAYCYVDWKIPEQPVAAEGLTRTTIERVNLESIKEAADRIVASGKPLFVEPEPAPTKKVTDLDMLDFLIANNLRTGVAEQLTEALGRIRLLARYYYHKCPWEQVREHETRTFLVAPLLMALGWSEQQTKIEFPAGSGNRADIVLYSLPFHIVEKICVMVIEAKGFSEGLDYAPDQAMRYAKIFPECNTLVATNGYCYKAFSRLLGDAFDITKPAAYLNLLDPRDRFPLNPNNVSGALEALKFLLPVPNR